MTTAIIITAIIAAATGAAIAYLAAAQRTKGLEVRAQYHKQQLDELRTAAERQHNALRQAYEARLHDADTAHSEQLEALRQAYEARLHDADTAHSEQLEALRLSHRQQAEQQAALLQEQIRTATEQLRTMSEEVLRSRQEELRQSAAAELGHIVAPLKASLADMQQQVVRTDKEHTEQMARLDETIKQTLRQTASVSQSAERLATALTADNKRQGNFGELQLQTLLDNMGFERGLQYETQVTLRDDTGTTLLDPDNGQRLQPDFIIHFPEGRDLIIDAKMSLKAFTQYFNATDDAARAEAVRRHVQSVRGHVDELAAKKYWQYITGSRQTVDFVVMYLYSDSALQLAMSADPQLWEQAAQKGVLITGSHNLYMMLRIVSMAWERMRQSENTQHIMEQANLIISRVQLFYTRLLDVEAQLHKTQSAFDALKTTTADHGQSIITPARSLLRLGAKEDKTKNKKQLPKEEE